MLIFKNDYGDKYYEDMYLLKMIDDEQHQMTLTNFANMTGSKEGFIYPEKYLSAFSEFHDDIMDLHNKWIQATKDKNLILEKYYGYKLLKLAKWFHKNCKIVTYWYYDEEKGV